MMPIDLATIDPRIKQLSYSGIQLAHSCPRAYQLHRLNTQLAEPDTQEDSITFAFGHAVGNGIADIFLGKSLDRALFNLFVRWPLDIFAEDTKRKKSLWIAMTAIQQFHRMCRNGAFADYELVHYGDGIPAVELGFKVDLGDGFAIRGFVDVVLRNTRTGEIVVLEIKTSSAAELNPAMFRNSAQALGYSVVLDVIFPELSAYTVIYYVFMTKSLTYEKLEFTKSYVQRALWIQETLLEKKKIILYEEAGVYPMHGESCINKYYRECKYLGICTMSTERLITPLADAPQRSEVYAFNISLLQLIDSQLSKATHVVLPTVPESQSFAQTGDIML